MLKGCRHISGISWPQRVPPPLHIHGLQAIITIIVDVIVIMIILYMTIMFLYVLGQGRRLTVLYHVVYFGGEKVTGWISELHCVPFEGLMSSFPPLKTRPDESISCHNSRNTSLVSKRHQNTWEKAVVQAESQLKVRRSSRLRTRGEFEAGRTQKESHGDPPEVSGHRSAPHEQLENNVSVCQRKRRRSSAEDGTSQSVVPTKKAHYEQAEVSDSLTVIDNTIHFMYAF